MQRSPIPKKVRFEVFKRDKFQCQYCGRASPDVILEIDHIVPVSKGGTNDIMNLITACRDCNRGKTNRELSDDAVIKKQKQQLDELQERREQIEMTIKWREGLRDEINMQAKAICDLFEAYTGFKIIDHGMITIKKIIRRFGFNETYTSTEIAVDYYYSGSLESAQRAFDKIGGICFNRAIAMQANECIHPERK